MKKEIDLPPPPYGCKDARAIARYLVQEFNKPYMQKRMIEDGEKVARAINNLRKERIITPEIRDRKYSLAA